MNPITLKGPSEPDSVIIIQTSDGSLVRIYDQGNGVPRVFIELPPGDDFGAFGHTLCTVIVRGKEQGCDARAHLSVTKTDHGPSRNSLRAKLNIPKRGSDIEKTAVMTYWK